MAKNKVSVIKFELVAGHYKKDFTFKVEFADIGELSTTKKVARIGQYRDELHNLLDRVIDRIDLYMEKHELHGVK